MAADFTVFGYLLRLDDGCEKNDRDLAHVWVFLHMRRYDGPVHIGHHDIQYYGIRFRQFTLFQTFFARMGSEYLVTFCLEAGFQHHNDGRFVIYNQYFLAHFYPFFLPKIIVLITTKANAWHPRSQEHRTFEYWNIGFKDISFGHPSILPSFHYSNFLCPSSFPTAALLPQVPLLLSRSLESHLSLHNLQKSIADS
jgi:hypothetical protein